MTEVHEEIAEHAGTRITQWVVISATAAEAMAQVAAVLARQAAARDEQARTAARREVEAHQAEARLQWEPMLDPRRRADSTLSEAGVAWASAQAWKDRDPRAQEVSDLAEDRLRFLHPTAMRHYDQAREQGVDPVTAMRIAAPHFDDVVHFEGPAAPERVRLERSGVALEAGPDPAGQTTTEVGPEQPGGPAVDPGAPATPTSSDAASFEVAAQVADVHQVDQTVTEQHLVARPDDPTTPSVDEHVEGLDLAVRPRAEAAAEGRSGDDLRQAAQEAKNAAAANPNAQTLGALSFPQPLNTTSARAAAASTGGGESFSPAQRSVVDAAQKAIQPAAGRRTR